MGTIIDENDVAAPAGITQVTVEPAQPYLKPQSGEHRWAASTSSTYSQSNGSGCGKAADSATR